MPAAAMPAAAMPAEYHETQGGRLLYARALIATADCLHCHGMPAVAPAAMRARFDGSPAWGLQPGDFAGIVSVSVPLDVGDTAAGLGAATWAMGTLAFGWLACLAVVLGWLQHRVIGAARAMEDYVRHLLSAKPAVHPSPFMVDSDEVASDNEMHRLSLALKAVHRVLRVARGERPP
jgi:hypothetical protein